MNVVIAMSRVLEADESGALTIPPDLLGHAMPHARYVVESKWNAVQIEPEDLPEDSTSLDFEEWLRQWRALGEEIDREWKSDKSAAEIISEMRR